MRMIFIIFITISSALFGIYIGDKLSSKIPNIEDGEVMQNSYAKLKYLTPDIFVYPLQAGGELKGYMVVRFALPMEEENSEKSMFPDEIITTDAFYSAMFSMRASGSAPDAIPSPDSLKSMFVTYANVNAGYQRYQGAFLQQFDYFEPDTMRRKNVRDRNMDADSNTVKPH